MLRIGSVSLAACLVAGVLAQGRPDIINYFGGHRSAITGVATSADGNFVATAQSGVYPSPGIINIFNLATGQLSMVLEGGAIQVSFSPNGQRLIARDGSGFTVFDTTSGSMLRRVGVDGYFFNLSTGAVSTDATRAAGLVSDGTARIWNLETGAIEKTFAVSAIAPASASFSPDGSALAVGSASGNIQLYSTNDGSLLRDIAAHGASVSTLSYRGTTILSGSSDRTVKTWNSQTGALIRQMNGHSGQVLVARMSANGQYIVSGAGNSELILWNANTGGVICGFGNHQGNVRAADFTPDSAQIISADDGVNANQWRIDGLALIRNLSNHKGEVDEVAISPDGRTVASGATDGRVKLWRGATLLRTLSFGTAVYTLAFSPNSSLIAVGGGVMTRIYDVNTGAQLGITFHGGVSKGVAFAQDSQTLYSTCTGGEIKRIALNGSQQWLIHLPGPVLNVAVPQSGNFVAAATLHSNQTQVWTNINIVNSADGSVLRSWTAHTDYIRGMAFTPDGKLVTAFFGGLMRAWDPLTGGQLWSRSGPGGITALTIAPKGDVIMTGEHEEIRLFRTSDGAQLRTYDAELPNEVNSVAFSLDERWFAYGLDTGTFATARSPFASSVESATLVRGSTVSGGVGSLEERDGDYWRMGPDNTSSRMAPVQVVLRGSAAVGTASRLTFRVVAGASSAGLRQDIELFDFQANAWQVVDTRTCSTSDQLVTFEQTSNAVRFLDPWTREVFARVSWTQVGPVSAYPWQLRLDQAYWVIVP